MSLFYCEHNFRPIARSFGAETAKEQFSWLTAFASDSDEDLVDDSELRPVHLSDFCRALSLFDSDSAITEYKELVYNVNAHMKPNLGSDQTSVLALSCLFCSDSTTMLHEPEKVRESLKKVS